MQKARSVNNSIRAMKTIYLDHAATTPVDEAIFAAMLPYFREQFGNPSSIHRFGLEVRNVLTKARNAVADALQVRPNEVTFTSGGTEANNLAIFGVTGRYESPRHIITSAIEHPSVLRACEFLESNGWKLTRLPVNEYGEVDPAALRAAITGNTVLISIMAANNETGTLQPIEELARIAAEHEIPFHTDAVQAFGKVPLDLRNTPISLLTLSGHKIYGPKGIGALFVRKGIRLAPMLRGGGQEEGLRAGTENVPAIAGLGKAVELMFANQKSILEHVQALSDRFIRFVKDNLRGAVLNGHPERRVPGIVNFSFPPKDSLSLVMALDLKGIAVSNGSACSSGNLEPSHVLRAMQRPAPVLASALRFSFGKDNTEADLEALQQALLETVNAGRAGRKANR